MNLSLRMEAVDKKFESAMWDIYHTAKIKCNYNATIFMNMLTKYGGVETAKRLLSAEKVQYGFTELWLCNCLDLTVEAHVLKPEFKYRFTEEEQKKAKKRLLDHDPTFFKKIINQ